MSGVIYDISIPVSSQTPCWPGDPAIQIERSLDLAKGDSATVSQLRLGSHTGTHVDAFSHFKPDGKTLDQMDLARYIGRALVVEIEDPEKVTLGELQRCPSFMDLRKTERVLFKTANSRQQWYQEPFNEHFCHISPNAARFLIELGIKLVGIDSLSVEAYHAKNLYGEEAPTHHLFMDAGVYIVEGLNLANIQPGWYEMICLPLALKDGDGSPARVVLRDWVNPD